MLKPVPMEEWSKDHWSLLAYVATSFDGSLDRRRMRCNEHAHPLLVSPYCTMKWRDSYGTRLKGQVLPDHDDWDCLEDLEAEGLVEIISLVNGFVRLTNKGRELAHQLSQHKMQGGNFADFEPRVLYSNQKV